MNDIFSPVYQTPFRRATAGKRSALDSVRARRLTHLASRTFLSLVLLSSLLQAGLNLNVFALRPAIVNAHLLVNSIVQQTIVFIAQLATAAGVRAPLARIADEVFLGLTRELQAQGLKKKVIADMFGMGLRTYHRRVQSAEQSANLGPFQFRNSGLELATGAVTCADSLTSFVRLALWRR